MLTRRHPISSQFPLPTLEVYRHRFSLDRLQHGIDNIGYDVQVSPSLVTATRRITLQLIAKMSGVFELPDFNSRFNWHQEEKHFRQICRTVLEDAVNRAKFDSEPQVLYLAVSAVAAVFRDTVKERYNSCMQHVKHQIWRSEVNYNHEAAVLLQEDLANLIRHRDRNIRRVNRQLFRYCSDAMDEGVNTLFTIHFGDSVLLPTAFFDNPLLHQEDASQDEFLMQEYTLIGHRREDVHQYELFLAVIRDVVRQVNASTAANEAAVAGPTDGEPPESSSVDTTEVDLEGWIKCGSNIDALFNCDETAREIRQHSRLWGDRREVAELRKSLQIQQMRLSILQKEFQRRDLFRIVMAVPEVETLCRTFAPPLTPHEILQYLVDAGSRRRIRSKLKRIKKSYGEPFNLKPFREALSRIRRVPKAEKQRHLIAFARIFCRYHRDRTDFETLRAAMDHLNFPTEDKDIELSRANRSLYDFLLPSERVADDAPIVGHAVLKADVRGSTGIVSQMKMKGLNPATNFSMNFFNPISDILSRYGAQKVFIEGDAIILATSEKENRPDQWYSVARTCGMAMAILLIVHRYNRKNRQSDLPHLEIGIGISYANSAPTFFFDGDNRIMISPAINQADRLSSCFKSIRKRFSTLTPPFNVYVFQPVPEDRNLVSEPFIRYNVGGIELNAEGFEKLKREIQLKTLELDLPKLQREPVRVHVGSFPTLSGACQSLIIREAAVPMISLKNLRLAAMSDSRYYEVCTHPLVYKAVRERSAG